MAVERLAEGQLKTNEKVDKLIESMGKQEVILEKLSNIEKHHADSNKRVHKRIDDVEENIKAIKEIQTTTGCPAHLQAVTKYDGIVNKSVDERAECKEYIKENEKWKLNIYKVLISKAILIITGLIGIVYANLKG